MLAADSVLQNRYRIVRRLGEGGMGTVYEAIDERFDHQVAIKETHFIEEALRKQFGREARLLYKLRHPALARVIDHFTEGEGQYLVMDYIEGDDLWERLQKKGVAFSVEDVLKWADQLLDALHYLHSQDPPVIHRDIKPQNLKLSNSGQIILLDFGLAKGFAGQVSRVTTSGSIFGYTPNYAPLEQIQGTGTGPYSDLYSLAATLYHLVTGVVPPDVLSRLTATTDGQPDPLRPAHEVNKEASQTVAAVLNKAMAMGRTQRFQSALEMRQSLFEASRQPTSSTNELRETMLAHTVASQALPSPAIKEPERPLESTIASPRLHAQGQNASSEAFLAPSSDGSLKSTATSPAVSRRTKILIGVVFGTGLLFAWTYNLLTNKDLLGPASTGYRASSANGPQASPSPSANTAAFTVRIRARGESIWHRSIVDNGEGTEYLLQSGEAREFKPTKRLSIFLSRSKMNSIDLSINNRPAKLNPESRGGLVEIIITSDNYSQLIK